MDFDVRDKLTFGGLALMAIGAALIYFPLAFLLIGGFSFYLGMR